MKTETIVQETNFSQHCVLRLLRTTHCLDLCRARKFFSTENGKVRSMTAIAGQALPESPIQGRFREKKRVFPEISPPQMDFARIFATTD